MTADLSRAVMSLASRCLGADRQEWGMAMEAEFEAAVENGSPFVFAIGCLIAAWREMVRHDEGRLALANYTLVLGFIIPMAARQLQQAMNVFWSLNQDSSQALLATGIGRNPYLTWSQNSALPILLLMWLLPGLAHLGLAWVVVEKDWPRVVKFGALIGAAMMTLWLFAAILILNLSPLGAQVTWLAVELAGVLTIAQWHAHIAANAAREEYRR
jgi:hypothetical protein